MNEYYTTENLKEGMGVAFNWFGSKVIFTSDKLEEAGFYLHKRTAGT